MDYTQLAHDTATELGEGWTAQPHQSEDMARTANRFNLVHTDGRSLFMRFEAHNNKGKVNVSGVYPRDAAGGYVDPRDTLDYEQRQTFKGDDINVSINRGPAAIAREIERRLLPVYGPLLESVRACISRRDDHDRLTAATAAELAAAGALIRKDDGAGVDTKFDIPSTFEGADGWGRIIGSSVYFDRLSMDGETAAAFLQWLADRQERL